MLAIRLARFGKKDHPTYRLIVSDKRKDTKGKYLEALGTYDPFAKNEEDKVTLRPERIKHWLSVGAQPSTTVRNMLIDAKLIEGEKARTIGKRKKKKDEAKAEGGGQKAVQETEPAKTEEPKAENDDNDKAEAKPAEERKDDKPAEKTKPEGDVTKAEEEKKKD